jgi:hypothetical protein
VSLEHGTWWQDLSELSERLAAAPGPPGGEWYRLGDGYLEVRSEDARFGDRLRVLFRECAVDAPADDGLPRVSCAVRAPAGDEFALVTFDDPEPLDQAGFSLELFPDRGYREVASPVAGWRLITLPGPGGVGRLAVSGSCLLVERATPWQALAGSLAVNRLFRLQRNLLFFHAGSIGIRERGVLLVGPKGSGKTTLSLALAAAGHAFLGDEIAGVRVRRMELVPVRRSLAVRDGPRAAAVGQALERDGAVYEPFPDGTRRLRSYADRLFPGQSAAPLPLRSVVFLRGFGAEPACVALRPGREHLASLTPLGATLWGMPPFQRARDLLRLVTETRCYFLQLGPPDETAALLADSLED